MRSIISSIRKAYKTDFFRNVMTLLTGTAMGQAIVLLLSPIVTRLFTLQEFATFEQYTFLLSILMVVIAGRYEFAIMQPKSNEDARHIVALCMRIVFWSCLVLLVGFLLTGEAIAAFNHNPQLQWWLWTLPLALFAAGTFNTINYWFSRHGNYKVAAASKLFYSAGGEPVKLGMGKFLPGYGGLIISTVVSHWISGLYAWSRFKQTEPKGISHISAPRLKQLAHEYKAYPTYTVWGSLLNGMAQWAHVAVFTYYYGEQALVPIAFIALSRRIFFNPLGLLATSYGQVFYQRISVIESGVELRKFFVKNLLRFLAFASLLVGIVQILPANTLGFVFGIQWTEALVYLKILSYWYALNFVLSSLSFIFFRLHLQWYTLLSDIVHFTAVVASFAWSHAMGHTPLQAVQTMVAVKVCYLLVNGGFVLYFLNRNARVSRSKTSSLQA